MYPIVLESKVQISRHFTPKTLQYAFPTNEDVTLHNHNTIIKPKKINDVSVISTNI